MCLLSNFLKRLAIPPPPLLTVCFSFGAFGGFSPRFGLSGFVLSDFSACGSFSDFTV